jgi:hypothetical protein
MEGVAYDPITMSIDRKDAYFPTAHALFEDARYSAMVGDPVRGWTWIRLCHDADRAWPAHPSLPRWVKSPVIDYLVGVGLLALMPNDLYTIPGLDARREKAAKTASKAGQASVEGAQRDGSGQFTPRAAPTTDGEA